MSEIEFTRDEERAVVQRHLSLDAQANMVLCAALVCLMPSASPKMLKELRAVLKKLVQETGGDALFEHIDQFCPAPVRHLLGVEKH